LKKLQLFSVADKGTFFVDLSQFGVAFSFSFIYAFMPFYILRVSKFGPQETMIWIGLIMGSSSVAAAIAAPIWGRLTARYRPKMLYEVGMLCNGVVCLATGFTENLYLLLILRILLGALGAISTVGIVIISSLSDRETLNQNLSLYQNSMTAGALLSPPLGAYSVTLFGYRSAFVIAALIVFIFVVFCRRTVREVPLWHNRPREGKVSPKGFLWGWILSFIASVHLTFLPPILPHLLENFKMAGEAAVTAAGFIMTAYTATAILGNYFINKYASKVSLKRVMLLTCAAAALFQMLLTFAPEIWSFTAVRMLQTAAIAAIFPMIISVFALAGGGGTLGFINSSRFVGNAAGPFLATSVLAYSNFFILCLLIAALTVISLWGFLTAKE
jgi:MFS family permease